MKVIFLDVDGVLNNVNTFIKKQKEFKAGRKFLELDDNNINNLKTIVDATDAKIVLSSTWREDWAEEENGTLKDRFYLDGLRAKLADHGLTMMSRTPVTKHCDRGREILSWIEWQNNHGESVDKYVILDDMSMLFDMCNPLIGHHIVITDMLTGLTGSHAKRAIKILRGKSK